jgi:hypothetical protein
MKDRLQLTVPGAVVGAIGGLVAGVLAAFVGQPYGWAVATALEIGRAHV